MVGQGVLRECLLAPDVREVLSLGRSATGQVSGKLRELVRVDLLDFSDIESELRGFDACFFCLGVSSAGMSEERYTSVTYDLTLSVARTLARLPALAAVPWIQAVNETATTRARPRGFRVGLSWGPPQRSGAWSCGGSWRGGWTSRTTRFRRSRCRTELPVAAVHQ